MGNEELNPMDLKRKMEKLTSEEILCYIMVGNTVLSERLSRGKTKIYDKSL